MKNRIVQVGVNYMCWEVNIVLKMQKDTYIYIPFIIWLSAIDGYILSGVS